MTPVRRCAPSAPTPSTTCTARRSSTRRTTSTTGATSTSSSPRSARASCRRPRCPAVSFLKAPGYQDGHAGYSDPIDEQRFVVDEINALQRTPDWRSTAVVIAYDDSDGWYDHAYSGVTNPSTVRRRCAHRRPARVARGTPLAGQQGRCGYGPAAAAARRLAVGEARTTVDHTLTDQSSIIRFVEDNWRLARIPGSFDASPDRSTTSSTSAASSASRSTSSRCPSTRRPVNTSSGSGAASPRDLAQRRLTWRRRHWRRDVGERTNRGRVMSTMELHAPRPSLGEPLHRVLAGLRPVLQRALTRKLARHAVAAVAGPVVARRSPVSRDLTGAGCSRAPRGLGPRSGLDRTAHCTGVARYCVARVMAPSTTCASPTAGWFAPWRGRTSSMRSSTARSTRSRPMSAPRSRWRCLRWSTSRSHCPPPDRRATARRPNRRHRELTVHGRQREWRVASLPARS